jgi:hypothetical protein
LRATNPQFKIEERCDDKLGETAQKEAKCNLASLFVNIYNKFSVKPYSIYGIYN